MALLRRGNRLLKRNGRLLVRGGSSPVPPVPPVAPLSIRVKFTSGYTPTMGDTQTLVNAQENVWDITKNSTNWAYLFQNNENLLEVIDANITGVTDIHGAFQNTKITSMPLFDTSTVRDMGWMFYKCKDLVSVPLFDTSNVTSMAGTFSQCESLTTVPLFNTSNVRSMVQMFEKCYSLTEIPLFDTKRVTDMTSMFNQAGYKQQNNVSIPAFDLTSVESMYRMFYYCTYFVSGAYELYLAASSKQNVPSHSEAFSYCSYYGKYEDYMKIPEDWGGGYVEPQDTVTIGGKSYKTVTINGKTWMAENLDYLFPGCSQRLSTNASTTPEAEYYNREGAKFGPNGESYGLLYNWHAVKYLNDHKDELIPGWHVPTALGGRGDFSYLYIGDSSTVGRGLKSTTGWTSNAGTNEYGFNAYPVGYYNPNWGAEGMMGLGTNTRFWTITISSSSNRNPVFYYLSSSNNRLQENNDWATNMCSIRLVKDD